MCLIVSDSIKVMMNKLCGKVTIFMIYTRKSEYTPTVTNFASILANCLYFCGR